jgi:hypothetical protein
MGESGRKGLSIVPNHPAMFDLLTLHRADRPIEGEQPRMTASGYPPGRTAALSWTMATALLIAALLAVWAVASERIGVLEGVAVFVLAWVVLIVVIGEAKRIVRRRPRARPAALLLTSDRLVVVEGHRSGPRLVREEPAAAIDRFRIREPITVAAQAMNKPVLDLIGPGGTVLSLELPFADPKALRVVAIEAGLRDAEDEPV